MNIFLTVFFLCWLHIIYKSLSVFLDGNFDLPDYSLVFNLGMSSSYPDAFGKVVQHSGLEGDGLSTDHRVRHCELHKEGLEGSEGDSGRETKSSVIGQAESPCLPLSDGVRDSYSHFSHT
jgi:hypothetical protein